MPAYRDDREYANKHIKEIMHLTCLYIPETLIHEPHIEIDRKENTDLLLPEARISVHCRKPGEVHKDEYANEFTMRYRKPSGAKVELQKTIEGCGDFLFYGFANDDDTGLVKWSILDLDVFRGTLPRLFYQLPTGEVPWVTKDNYDSKFAIFNLNQFPEDLIIAKDDLRGNSEGI